MSSREDDLRYRTGDPGDEHVDWSPYVGLTPKKPEAPAGIIHVKADGTLDVQGGIWPNGLTITNELEGRRMIDADALLAWLLSRTGNEQIRLQCLAAHVLVERFLEEHSLGGDDA